MQRTFSLVTALPYPCTTPSVADPGCLIPDPTITPSRIRGGKKAPDPGSDLFLYKVINSFYTKIGRIRNKSIPDPDPQH
jgi:hypothetical protein